MGLFKRLFRKKPKRATSKDVIKQFKDIEDQLIELSHAVNQIQWKKDLVDPDQWVSKYKETMAEGEKFVFHYGSFLTHLRCLHQWQTNTPPNLKKEVTPSIETASEIAPEDQEFIDKLKEAKEWATKQK